MGSKFIWFCDRRHLEKLGYFCILANWETLIVLWMSHYTGGMIIQVRSGYGNFIMIWLS